MGLFGKIKELFSAKRYINRVMAEMDRQNERYAAMNEEELALLSDDDLCSAALYRIDQVIAATLGKPSQADPVEAMALLNDSQKTVFVLACWESELAGGGLCQFLTGDCGGLLPYISEMLSRTNAKEHLALLCDFAKANAIDLTRPSPYTAKNEFEYAEQQAKLPFADFNRAYRRLPSLELFIVNYIRDNLSCF